MQERDRLFRRAKQHNSQADWDLAKGLQAQADAESEENKRNKVAFLLEKYRDDPESFWRGVRKLLPKYKGDKMNTVS